MGPTMLVEPWRTTVATTSLFVMGLPVVALLLGTQQVYQQHFIRTFNDHTHQTTFSQFTSLSFPERGIFGDWS
jgi:hypothetical protein